MDSSSNSSLFNKDKLLSYIDNVDLFKLSLPNPKIWIEEIIKSDDIDTLKIVIEDLNILVKCYLHLLIKYDEDKYEWLKRTFNSAEKFSKKTFLFFTLSYDDTNYNLDKYDEIIKNPEIYYNDKKKKYNQYDSPSLLLNSDLLSNHDEIYLEYIIWLIDLCSLLQNIKKIKFDFIKNSKKNVKFDYTKLILNKKTESELEPEPKEHYIKDFNLIRNRICWHRIDFPKMIDIMISYFKMNICIPIYPDICLMTCRLCDSIFYSDEGFTIEKFEKRINELSKIIKLIELHGPDEKYIKELETFDILDDINMAKDGIGNIVEINKGLFDVVNKFSMPLICESFGKTLDTLINLDDLKDTDEFKNEFDKLNELSLNLSKNKN